MATAPSAREVLRSRSVKALLALGGPLERGRDRASRRPRQVRVRHHRARARPRPRRARGVRPGGPVGARHRPRRRPVRPSHGRAPRPGRRSVVRGGAGLVRQHAADRRRADLRVECVVRGLPGVCGAGLACALCRRRRRRLAAAPRRDDVGVLAVRAHRRTGALRLPLRRVTDVAVHRRRRLRDRRDVLDAAHQGAVGPHRPEG